MDAKASSRARRATERWRYVAERDTTMIDYALPCYRVYRFGVDACFQNIFFYAYLYTLITRIVHSMMVFIGINDHRAALFSRPPTSRHPVAVAVAVGLEDAGSKCSNDPCKTHQNADFLG